MDFRGKIIAVMPLQKGISKANGNEWKKQEYVIENHDQYPRKMCFNLWSDKIDQFNIQLGEELNVSFDIDAREYNGRWYNDIRAWKHLPSAQMTSRLCLLWDSSRPRAMTICRSDVAASR